MIYYMVKKEHDNKRLPKRLIYIQNELFTEKETAKYNVRKDFCYRVECSKKKTFWCFGARFAENKDIKIIEG